MDKTGLHGTVRDSKTKKKGVKYHNFSVSIPTSIGDQFCLENKQELEIEIDMSQPIIVLKPKEEERPSYPKMIKRINEAKLGIIKKRRRQIKTSQKLRLLRYIDYIKKDIKKIEKIIKKYQELLKNKEKLHKFVAKNIRSYEKFIKKDKKLLKEKEEELSKLEKTNKDR